MILTRDRRSGALFRTIDRHGRTGGRLTVEGVTKIRCHVAELLQRDPAGYSGHSLRAGFVAEARAASPTRRSCVAPAIPAPPACTATTVPKTSSPTPSNTWGSGGSPLAPNAPHDHASS
jgi:hypothetical protein